MVYGSSLTDLTLGIDRDGLSGNLPPQRTDLGTPIGTVLLWAGLTALTTALIDVMIQRGAAKYEEHRMLSHQVGPGGQHSAGA